MKINKRLELASHSVDLAWDLFNDLTAAELKELPPEIRRFKTLVDQARELSYDLIAQLNRTSCREALQLHLVD